MSVSKEKSFITLTPGLHLVDLVPRLLDEQLSAVQLVDVDPELGRVLLDDLYRVLQVLKHSIDSKVTTGANVIKLFLSVIYEFS